MSSTTPGNGSQRPRSRVTYPTYPTSLPPTLIPCKLLELQGGELRHDNVILSLPGSDICSPAQRAVFEGTRRRLRRARQQYLSEINFRTLVQEALDEVVASGEYSEIPTLGSARQLGYAGKWFDEYTHGFDNLHGRPLDACRLTSVDSDGRGARIQLTPELDIISLPNGTLVAVTGGEIAFESFRPDSVLQSATLQSSGHGATP